MDPVFFGIGGLIGAGIVYVGFYVAERLEDRRRRKAHEGESRPFD